MAEKIFIADKPTQDAIKIKTDLIGVANPTIGNSNNIMNFIKKLDDKYDPSNVIPLYRFDGSTGTVCNISGKGFITNAYVATDGSGPFGIKITVDGVVTFNSVVSNNAFVTGVVQPSILHLSNTDFSSFSIATPIGRKEVSFLHSSLKKYPYIYKSGEFINDAATILESPIYFKNSLLVEVSGVGGSNWIVTGGLY